MKHLVLIFSLLTALVACKKETTTAQAALGSSSNSCLIGKWSDASLPLTVKMSSDFSGDISAGDLVNGLNPLEQMAKNWNDPFAGSKTLITLPFPIAGSTGYSTTQAFRDSEIGIYKSHTWFSNQSSGVLAITQFFGIVSSSPGLGQYIDLTHADIIVNYRDYGSRFTMSYNPTAEFDLPTVLQHEMGHLLGLCHEKTKSSIMAPYYLTTQRSLQAFDEDIIKDVYLDSALSAMRVNSKNKNTNALSSPVGTEVKGIIELRESGDCIHYLEGKKIHQHKVRLK